MALHDSKPPRDQLGLAPKHRVFLSHCGVQKGFAQQLDSDLRQRDRHPFFDKDRGSLPVGEVFPPLIFEAIRQCQVGVVILSEEFFSSKWPMLELLEMVQTMEDKPDQMKIIPIYLSVSCADLGDENKLSDWKAKWCVFAETDERINIPSWEKALRVLKLTNGLVFDSRVGEVKFREEIVKEICNIVPPFHRWDDSHVQGRTRLTQIIHNKIEETPISTVYGVQAVGLYGVGGIGKTTACKLLCNDFEKEFAGRACHIEFGNGTEMDLLQKILKKLTKTTHELLKELTIDECRARLKDIMQSGRVFLAIDNVSSNSKIIDEARRYLRAGYEHGSIVVVTARSLGELENLRIDTSECLPMPELEEDEAKALFLYHVAPRNEIDKEILVQCIHRCYFCKGNDESHHYHPLALEVLAKQLGPSDPKEWSLQLKEVDTFNQLREPENPVFSILRRSFDMLLHEDKVLFMDVAIFHSKPSEFWDSDYNLRAGTYWNVFEWLSVAHGSKCDVVKKRLNNLKMKSLLEDLGDGTSGIGIHDLWWEFALMETKFGENESRRWVFEIDESECESEDCSLSDEGEDCSLSDEGEDCSLSDEGEDLSLSDEGEDLSLSDEGEDLSLSDEGEDLSLSDEGEDLSERQESSDSSLASEVKVVETSLSGGGWENLQRISVIGKSLSQNRVMSINFSNCSKVMVLRLANANVENGELDLSGLKQMKILEIVYSDDFVMFQNAFAKLSGVGQVTKLRVLIWMNISIESTSDVEQISNLTNLQVLQLNFTELCEDSESSRYCKKLSLDLSQLRLLRVARIQFEGKFTISGFSSEMTKLEVLDLTGCRRLRNCPDVGNIIGLKVLMLSGCCNLEGLPNLRKLKNLLILDIKGCLSLIAVAALGSLVALRELRARDCYKLQAMPDMSKLTNLQILDVKNCHSLECIPGLSNLIALHKFVASAGSKFLENLPDRRILTKSLEVRIYGPEAVTERDGNTSQGEDALSKADDESREEEDESCNKDIVVASLEDVESSQEDDESSPQELKPVLNLAIMKSVIKLALCGVNHELSNLSKLTRLEDLDIQSCGFKTLSGLSHLTAMKKLYIYDCSLKNLPDMGKHMSLEFLKIWDCKRLRGWDGVGRLGSSESQSSVDFHCDWTLPLLKVLHMSDVYLELPDLSHFPQLKVLKLEYARRRRFSIAEFVLRCLADHVQLEILHCVNWPIVELPDLSRFPQLRVLYLEECSLDRRSSIPDLALHCLTNHLQLEILRCIDWPIAELPDLSKFRTLKRLEVKGCNTLTCLTSSGPLTALEVLRLKRIPSLKALPDVFLMPRLRRFSIARCGVTLNAHEVENLRPRCAHFRVDNSSWESGHLRAKFFTPLREIESTPDSGSDLLVPDKTEDLVSDLVASLLVSLSLSEGYPSGEPNDKATLDELLEQAIIDIVEQFKKLRFQ